MNGPGRWLACVPVALALTGCGFTGNLRMDPGFASFRMPATLRDTERETAVSLGPVPLRLATMISRPIFKDDDPWITETLSTIRAVRVYTYAIDGDFRNVERHVATTRAELLADGWHSVTAVREDGGLVAALVRHHEPHVVRGVAVLYQDEHELVLVNVIGSMQPESFGVVMARLDIDVPAMMLGANAGSVEAIARARTE